MDKVKKINGVIFPEPRVCTVDKVGLPRMRPTDVLVDVEYSSVSIGTERWCLTAQMEIPGNPPMAFPHVPGYQAAGVVKDAGFEVRDIEPGDRVFSRNCREPENFRGSWWGGHVGVHITDHRSVLKLPQEVSTKKASSLLLAQVGYNGANKPRVTPGDVAVVIGEGLVGQYAGQVLRHRGAQVIMAGLMKSRLQIAEQYSADEIIDNSKDDLRDLILQRYPEGVPIVVETASSSETIRLAIDLLSRNGQLVLNGYYPPSESILDWHWLRRKEITLYCPDSRTRERLEATLELIRIGHIKVEELVTHTCSYRGAPEMYRMLLDGSVDFLGIVFDWKSFS
jgi:2-desacetyl-2-hydroxyethyl bacteriochlorophyllide A dehydrogenase